MKHENEPNDMGNQQVTLTRSRRSFLHRAAQGATVAAVAATVPAMASGTESAPMTGEHFIGEVVMFAGNFAPRGWAFCDGQTIPIQQNQALYSILGTTYGGDGRTNFKLPNLKKHGDRLGVKYIIALSGVFPSRS